MPARPHADADAIGQGDVLALPVASCSMATRRRAAPRRELAHSCPGPLGAIMITSTPAGGTIWLKRMLKPWQTALALGQVRLDGLLVDVRLDVIGYRHYDHVSGLGHLVRRGDVEAGLQRRFPGGVVRALPTPSPCCRCPGGYWRVRGPGAEADDADGLALQQGQLAIFVSIDLGHHSLLIQPYSQ